jgi:hypothetical protein
MLDPKDILTTLPDSQDGAGMSPSAKSGAPRFAVRHYTVGEVADLWRLSEDCVRRIFEREPGVLVLGDAKPTRYKRRYRTLRIPEFVLDRVHRRLSQV